MGIVSFSVSALAGGAGIVLLAACGGSSPSPGAQVSAPRPAAAFSSSAAAPSASAPGAFTYSTSYDPVPRAATAAALDQSTADYFNAHYPDSLDGLPVGAVDEQCTPTTEEMTFEKPFVVWSCDYVTSRGMASVEITGPHTWKIAAGG